MWLTSSSELLLDSSTTMVIFLPLFSSVADDLDDEEGQFDVDHFDPVNRNGIESGSSGADSLGKIHMTFLFWAIGVLSLNSEVLCMLL